MELYTLYHVNFRNGSAMKGSEKTVRLRIITKDKRFVDYDVKTPIYISTTNLNDKYAVMIVEELPDEG